MRRVMLYVKYYREDWWEPAWDAPREVIGKGGNIQKDINELLAGNKYPIEQDGIIAYELREA